MLHQGAIGGGPHVGVRIHLHAYYLFTHPARASSLRLARVNLPVGTFEFANSFRPFSPRDPQHGFNAQPWVRFASPLARRVKPYVSGEMRTRLQDSWHRTYNMDI